MLERDIGESRVPVQLEEAGEHRAAEVEVDQRHALPGACERDREVGDRRRLAFFLEAARDHDRACAALEVGELEVRAQHAECLGLRAVRVLQHHELPLVAQPARRLGDAGEQRKAEALADLVRAADARVERVPEEGEADRRASRPARSRESPSRRGLGPSAAAPNAARAIRQSRIAASRRSAAAGPGRRSSRTAQSLAGRQGRASSSCLSIFRRSCAQRAS